jgi:glycosyltransferase involved in cell wall biosynthesis
MEKQDQQSTSTGKTQSPFTSIVLPARNEAASIEAAIETISDTLASCSPKWEIVVVDDGSDDCTFEEMQKLARQDPRIRAIQFSRNFGKEAAILAGLQYARGDVVITMDADLQHPPELIPQMLQCWSEGAMVVNAVKRSRSTDGILTRIRANLFNNLISSLGGIDMHDASDFKLLDRVVVDQVADALPERERFYRGLTDWVGYPSVGLQFDVKDRVGGEGKWSILKLAELALTALVSFTSAPLRIVTLLGIATLILGFFIGADALISWARGDAVSGFATVIITLLLIGSFVMISLGIMGEYIAKIYEEVKRRPSYIVESTTDSDNTGTD